MYQSTSWIAGWEASRACSIQAWTNQVTPTGGNLQPQPNRADQDQPGAKRRQLLNRPNWPGGRVVLPHHTEVALIDPFHLACNQSTRQARSTRAALCISAVHNAPLVLHTTDVHAASMPNGAKPCFGPSHYLARTAVSERAIHSRDRATPVSVCQSCATADAR